MFKIRKYKIIPWLIVVIGILSVQQWIDIPITNTFLTWIVEAALLCAFVLTGIRRKNESEYKMPWQLIVYLVMVAISCIYGIYMSEGYWDYKLLLTNALTFLSGLSYLFFVRPSSVTYTLRIWLYVSAIVFWVLLPFMQKECVGRFLTPVAFLLIFFPFYNKKTLLIVLFLTACVFIFGSLGARSNVFRFLVCGAIGVGVYFRKYIPARLLKCVIALEFVTPMFFLILGITGVFNVFQLGDNVKGLDVEVTNSFDSTDSENLGDDTRTFIYLEETASAVAHNYVVQGRSLARGYDSDFFGDVDMEMSGRGERGSSEVSILNIFNYFGLIGVAIYLILFCGAVLSVFKKSQNKILFFVAVFIGYKWIWAFVEDFSNFDVNNICMWIALSMCYSPFFLRMNERQIGRWARRIINL